MVKLIKPYVSFYKKDFFLCPFINCKKKKRKKKKGKKKKWLSRKCRLLLNYIRLFYVPWSY